MAKEQWGQTSGYKEYEENANNQSPDAQKMGLVQCILLVENLLKISVKLPEVERLYLWQKQ